MRGVWPESVRGKAYGSIGVFVDAQPSSRSCHSLGGYNEIAFHLHLGAFFCVACRYLWPERHCRSKGLRERCILGLGVVLTHPAAF